MRDDFWVGLLLEIATIVILFTAAFMVLAVFG